jgi:transmembrane sensor
MASPVNPASPDWEKIGRYLAGESSPDEAAAVRRWLDENRGDAALVAALDGAARTAAAPPAVNVEAALQRVKARAKDGARRTGLRFTGFAAVAAAAALAAVLIPWRSSQNRDVTRSPNTGAPTRVEFATRVGVTDSLRLPDSSLAVLGPDSRIVYNSNDEARIVQLHGQAFFRVAHETARSFSVRAGATTIRDIGTAFSVDNAPSEPVRVVVTEGAVEVIGADSATLRAGDVALIGPNGDVETRRGVATADDLAWTTGRLTFRDASLAEVAADLRRWYGVEIRVTDSTLLRRHFTGSFAREPLERVLDVLALAIPMRIERRGDTVYARPVSPAK